MEVAGSRLVVQGACLFSGAWGQHCILFLSIYSQRWSSEIFLTNFLLFRDAKIGPFDPVCLTDYARYQWRTPNLSKSVCSPPTTTHISWLFLFSFVLWCPLEGWSIMRRILWEQGFSPPYGRASLGFLRLWHSVLQLIWSQGVSQTSPILALLHQCYSLQQYSSFSFAMSMETCLGRGGNEERETHGQKSWGQGLWWITTYNNNLEPNAFIMYSSHDIN